MFAKKFPMATGRVMIDHRGLWHSDRGFMRFLFNSPVQSTLRLYGAQPDRKARIAVWALSVLPYCDLLGLNKGMRGEHATNPDLEEAGWEASERSPGPRCADVVTPGIAERLGRSCRT